MSRFRLRTGRRLLDQGNYSGSFVIASNGGSETIVVSITVNGLTLEVEPAELDFGTVTGSLQLTLNGRSAKGSTLSATFTGTITKGKSS